MIYFAKIGKRSLEALIDYGIVYTVTFAYLFAFGKPNEEGVKSLEGIEALPVFGLWFLYFPIVEGLTGQTLGKKILGIRVVTLSGGDITIWNSFVRRFFDSVDLMFFGLVAILVIKNSSKSQRVGDLLAKTIVIEDEVSTCEKCNGEFTLSQHEVTCGKFICPNCKHENLVQIS